MSQRTRDGQQIPEAAQAAWMEQGKQQLVSPAVLYPGLQFLAGVSLGLEKMKSLTCVKLQHFQQVLKQTKNINLNSLTFCCFA